MNRTLIEARIGFRFHIGGDEPDLHAGLRVHEAAYGAMERALRALPDWRTHLPNGPGPDDDAEAHYAQICDIDTLPCEVDGTACFCLWIRREADFDRARAESIRDAVAAVYRRHADAAGLPVAYRGALSSKTWRLVETEVLQGL